MYTLKGHLWLLSSGVHTQVVGPMTSFWAHFRHILAPLSSQPPSSYLRRLISDNPRLTPHPHRTRMRMA